MLPDIQFSVLKVSLSGPICFIKPCLAVIKTDVRAGSAAQLAKRTVGQLSLLMTRSI